MGKKTIIFIVTMILLPILFLSCGLEPGDAVLKIKTSACSGCNECSGVCSYNAIRIINGKAVIDPAKCVECGRCVEVCPNNAIY